MGKLWELDPTKFPPPCIQTITALGDLLGHSGAQTFRKRQSSLAALGSWLLGSCAQGAPYAVASRTPAHAVTGIGSRQRNAPTGGAAYGMPLNTAPPFSSIAPLTSPPVTVSV